MFERGGQKAVRCAGYTEEQIDEEYADIAKSLRAKAIVKACEFKPSKRYGTAKEMKQALLKAAQKGQLDKPLTPNPIAGVGINSGRSSVKPHVSPVAPPPTPEKSNRTGDERRSISGRSGSVSSRRATEPVKNRLKRLIAAISAVIVVLLGLLVWLLLRDASQAPSGQNAVPVAAVTATAVASKPSSTPASAPPTNTPTNVPTKAPTPVPTDVPTPTPVPLDPIDMPMPTPSPTPVPATTPMPILNAAADESAAPEAVGLNATVMNEGKDASSFTRKAPASILNPFTSIVGGADYAMWRQAGVLAFRSGPMRQNAAYGVLDVQSGALTQVWSRPVGSMKTYSGMLYGVSDPGQPVIVKWPVEMRQRMGINHESEAVTALMEVIIAGQDGKLYFYNLLTGEATRDPIDLGAPSPGGISVATNGTPILGVGQHISRLAKKTVKNGYHIIDLLNNKKIKLIFCDGKDRDANYTGVTGAALFDNETGAMIFGSQNGLLHTVELGDQKKTAYDHQSGKLNLNYATQSYKAQAKGQDECETNIDGSIAMYNNLVFYGDQTGILQCVNVNTLTPVWAVHTGDNIDSTPALDLESEDTLALYTGNTYTNQGRNGVVTIRRVNALTGQVDWTYDVPELKKGDGVFASPVVGQNTIADLVIFTVSRDMRGAQVIALDKKTGAVKWQTLLETNTISSPVAVYNHDGDAWLAQAEGNGKLHLLNAQTGAVLNTLTLSNAEGAAVEIKASPAVYGNLLVIGATGEKMGTGGVYCVRID